MSITENTKTDNPNKQRLNINIGKIGAAALLGMGLFHVGIATTSHVDQQHSLHMAAEFRAAGNDAAADSYESDAQVSGNQVRRSVGVAGAVSSMGIGFAVLSSGSKQETEQLPQASDAGAAPPNPEVPDIPSDSLR